MNNSPGSTSSRKFFKSPSLKSQIQGMGADLDSVQNFIPTGSGQVFLTQQKSQQANTVRNRKGSHAPSLPQLDYISRQDEQNRYRKGQSPTKGIQSVQKLGQRHASLKLDPSAAQFGMSGELKTTFGNDFAKMHMEASATK
mgnify:CR=1 FL=1